MYWINSENCTGCGSCMDVCSVGAIFMVDGKAHIDETRCNLCGECLDVCANDAIQATDKVVAQEPSVQVEKKAAVSTLMPNAAALGASVLSFALSKLKDLVSSQIQNLSISNSRKGVGKMEGGGRGYRKRHGTRKRKGW